MTTFLDGLRAATNLTTTENGALTNASSLDPVVDFFAQAGAMRDRAAAAADLFEKAYCAEPLTAVRTMFYLRDVRGGQGERDVFRACLRKLAAQYPGAADAVLHYVPQYGRWDDIFYSGSHLSAAMVDLVETQLRADANWLKCGQGVSLLAKWLPSDKAKDQEQLQLAINLRRALGMSQREYRKMLTVLRARIGLLETDLSHTDASGIEFGKVPSQAHRRHIKAFRRRQPERYQAYLDSVTRGESKINVSTLYPYEVYNLVAGPGRGATDSKAADVMWANLPDYTRGNDALVMADVSGSMYHYGKSANPIAVSISLALYFAERNVGEYHGYYMTFSGSPTLVRVPAGTLSSKVEFVQQHGIGYNTNIVRAFAAILDAGKRSGSVPETLYIISDMEFDAAVQVEGGYGMDTIFQTTRAEFAKHGLRLPHVVFWNVDARHDNLPATILDGAVTLVSGLSPTVFSMAVEGKSPRELVDSVVNGERYQKIVI